MTTNEQPQQPEPVCILIAALGGEGGGVLTDWIVQAAMAAELPVQSTSIPGVAQRTGATTYYLELLAKPIQSDSIDERSPTDRSPVMALYPGPGHIDLMVASELLEVGRALENGFVSPERTTLIGSTHRVFAMAEKTAMSDQRYAIGSILQAAQTLSKRLILADLAQLAEQHDTVLNAVLLGIIAGTEQLPITDQQFTAAIRASGIAIELNLRGFELGRQCAKEDIMASSETQRKNNIVTATTSAKSAVNELLAQWPEATHDIVSIGYKRVCDYQDKTYGQRYLQRLDKIRPIDGNGENYRLSNETARYLALWMTYEDVIRVAEIKTSAQRLQKIRAEVRAERQQPLRITEFAKPGFTELAALLPPSWGRRLLRWVGRKPERKNYHLSMRLRSDTVSGFLRLWLLARLRFWRPRTLRFAEEQQLIDRWLESIAQVAERDYSLALEIAECANLNKGYSDTFERGRSHFIALLEHIIEPAVSSDDKDAAQRVRTARQAALADPDKTLTLVKGKVESQPINWYPAANPE